MKLVFDRKSPECGWDPFVNWLNDQGVKATDARRLELNTETMDAEVVLYKQGRTGTTTRSIRLTSLPPVHPSRPTS